MLTNEYVNNRQKERFTVFEGATGRLKVEFPIWPVGIGIQWDDILE